MVGGQIPFEISLACVPDRCLCSSRKNTDYCPRCVESHPKFTLMFHLGKNIKKAQRSRLEHNISHMSYLELDLLSSFSGLLGKAKARSFS